MQETVQLVNHVRAYGRPNIYAAQVPLSTSWNISLCLQLAESVHDREVAWFLLYGWSLNHDGRPTAMTLRNHSSAVHHRREVYRYLEKEFSLGCLAGPFCSPPWDKQVAISPMSTTPKKDTTSRRIIMDLSWPRDGTAVNDGIDKERYLWMPAKIVYPTIDAICRRAEKIGSEAMGYKKDMNRAFKQLFMQPNDWPLLGISWEGGVFFDKTAVMGSISAPYICQRTTSFIRHIMNNLNYFVFNYVDDFMGVEHKTRVYSAYSTLGNLLRDLGATEAEDKAAPPSEVVEMLGILFNFKNLTMSVTSNRLKEIRCELLWWLRTETFTRRQLESLLGKLQFISLCVRPGRVLMHRLREQLRQTPDSGRIDKRVETHRWIKTSLGGGSSYQFTITCPFCG